MPPAAESDRIVLFRSTMFAAVELIVSPAHAYIYVKKWESAQKARWLDQARDELNELSEHLKQVR